MRLIHRLGSLPRSVRLLGAATVVATAIFGNLPNNTEFWQTLQNFCHCPAFVAVSIIFFTLLPVGPHRPGWVRYALTLLACLLVGAGIEFAQSFIGGDVSAQDVFTDLLGTSIGLSIQSLLHGRDASAHKPLPRSVPIIVGLVALGIALQPVVWMLAAYVHRDREFPVLAAFQKPIDLFFLEVRKSDRTLVTLPSPLTDGRNERGMRVELWAERVRPGIYLAEPVPNWTGYQTLALDLANDGDSAVTLRMRIHDWKHNQQLNDRFNRTLQLPPHSRQVVRIPLQTIESAPLKRKLDMREIAGIGLFNPRLDVNAVFYLNRIWLERAPAS